MTLYDVIFDSGEFETLDLREADWELLPCNPQSSSRLPTSAASSDGPTESDDEIVAQQVEICHGQGRSLMSVNGNAGSA